MSHVDPGSSGHKNLTCMRSKAPVWKKLTQKIKIQNLPCISILSKS